MVVVGSSWDLTAVSGPHPSMTLAPQGLFGQPGNHPGPRTPVRAHLTVFVSECVFFKYSIQFFFLTPHLSLIALAFVYLLFWITTDLFTLHLQICLKKGNHGSMFTLSSV